MKNKSPVASEAPSAAPAKNNNLDGLIPEPVFAAERLELERVQLTAAIAENKQIHEQASADFRSALKLDFKVQKNADQAIAYKGLRDCVAEQLVDLESRLEDAESELIPVSYKAAGHVDTMCSEVARGHQEVAAQAIASHFASIKDARRKCRETPAVISWLSRRLFPDMTYGAKMERVSAMAREAAAELSKLREKLGGEIPSAAEMTKL